MKKCLPAIIFGIILSFQCIPLFSQVSLVKDINTIPAQPLEAISYTPAFCECNGQLFFSTATTKGRELWKTNGTEDGTILIKDLNKGIADGGSPGLCNGQGQLFFYGNDGLHGTELWVTDGTLEGTRMVKDVTPGPSAYIVLLGMLGNTIYFMTDSDLNSQPEIWKSDGSENNTKLATNLEFSFMPTIYAKMESDTHIFFNTINIVSGKFELWAIDGASENAEKLIDNVYIAGYQKFGNKILFSVHDFSSFEYSLWSSDGSSGGTVVVKDFNNSSLQSFHKFNDKLIFSVYGETWISDGTEIGTTFLVPGYCEASAVINNNFYGLGYDYVLGSNRIFKMSGATIESISLNSALGELVVLNNIPVLNDKLIIQYFDQNVGTELGMVESNLQAFTLIKDINPGSNSSEPRAWGTINDKVLFFADDGRNGVEIWATDGTEAGSYLVKNITTGTGDAFFNNGNTTYLTSTEGKLHFLAIAKSILSLHNLELFSSDGTEAGTKLKFTFSNDPVKFLGKISNDLIYANALKFYKTNASTDDVTLFKDFTGVSTTYNVSPYSYSLGDKIIFSSSLTDGSYIGYEYWVTDGTDAGTKLLKDIFPGDKSGAWTGRGIVSKSKFLFNATHPDHGMELWITDGSPSGTVLLKDINPGVPDSNPGEFVVFGDKVIFNATDGQYGTETWITDGTEHGTMLLLDIVAGAGSSGAKYFTSIGDLVLFTAYDEENGWALWKTDGTTSGTALLKDIQPGNENYLFPKNFASINNKLYFAADDGEHGMELWVSDGSKDGTFVIDIVPGLEGSNPSVFTNVNGVAYFQADAMLWRSNGTTTGTFNVSDLEPLEILALDNWVYFIAPHPDYGKELFKVEFKKLEQQITFDPIDSKTVADAPFQMQAEASSGLPVTIASGDELAIDNGTLSIVKAGTVEVTIQQLGDALYNPAQVSETFCVFPAKPSITVGEAEGETILVSSSDSGNQWLEQNESIAGATQKTLAPEEDGVYKVNVTIDGCTSESSDEEVIVITGIEIAEDFILLYPNPAHDHLNIKAAGKKTEVTIFDIHGRLMNTIQMDGDEVAEQPLQGFHNGVYLVKIASDRGVSYYKFAKE